MLRDTAAQKGARLTRAPLDNPPSIREMSGSSAGATCPPPRWSRCSSSGSIATPPSTKRRCQSSPQPEQLRLPTNGGANSYTTSWDLTPLGRLQVPLGRIETLIRPTSVPPNPRSQSERGGLGRWDGWDG